MMRVRNIELIIYDYNILQDKIQIIDDNLIEYAYILHDKDIDEKTGDIKKAHYHLRVFDDNQRSISAWAKLFNVKENDIQVLENKRRAIRYLIHLDSPKKHQYSNIDIVTNIVDIDNYFNEDKVQEDSQLANIFSYIDTIRGYIYFREIKAYVLQNNYWGVYRRYYSIIKDVILEHNRYCIDYMLN